MRGAKLLILSVITLILSSCLALYGYISYFYSSPLHTPDSSEQAIFYSLKPGMGAAAMCAELKTKGLLSALQAKTLLISLRYQKQHRSLQTGEYYIPFNITPEQLISKITRGEVIQYAFLIKEGSTVKEVLRDLAKQPKLMHIATNQSLAEISAQLGSLPFLEGQFFPETYFYTAGMTDLDILKRAHQLLVKKLSDTWHNRSPHLMIQDSKEALILASLIEKEAMRNEERAEISGVFHRRLAKKMRLQCDPTVIYGLEDYHGILTRVQLKRDSPYNTYTRSGLPPTPIAMVSIQSLQAAVHPDSGAALYFVAKGDGRHHFSVSLEEHLDAVKQYQR